MTVADTGKDGDKDNSERDRLWYRTFDAIYDTLYNEIEMGTYIRRLEFINTAAAAAAFVTAGSGVGALIAKQTVWKTPGGEWIWVSLLIIAGVVEGVRRSIDPGRKIPVVQQLVADLTNLESNLEEFRSVMAADKNFDVSSATKKYAALTKRSMDLTRKCPTSFLLHLKVRRKCQAETTERLKHML